MDLVTLAMAKKYTDSQRLGYVDDGEVIFNGTLSKNPDFAATVYSEGIDTNKLTVGKEYIITTDSGTFTSVCKQVSDGMFVIGNMNVLGGEDTSESFTVASYYENGWIFAAFDFYCGTHMKVVAIEAIHPIDPKFLPGVCLPVVEITDLTAITAEESAKLTACIGAPIIVKATIDGATISDICTYIYGDGAYIFKPASAMLGVNCVLSEDGTNWFTE